LLFDDVTQQLYFQVATNLDEPTMRGLSIPLEGSIAGWIVTKSQADSNHQCQEDPRLFANVDRITGNPTRLCWAYRYH